MKQICQICNKEMDKKARFTKKTTYNMIGNLWTEIDINGRFEYFSTSRPFKPLCKECAIKILENTIKTLKEGDK